MSSGGGGSGNTTTTTSNIPEYLQAPTEQMIARGQALTGPDAQYQQYQGQRVADFSPMQMAAYQGIAGLQTPQQYGQAQGALSNAQDIANAGALGASTYAPGVFQAAGYNPAQQGAMGVTTQNFDQNAMQQYMSPYQQGVTDIAKREALLQGQNMLDQIAGKAAMSGAFGGSRFGLEEAQGIKNLNQQLSDIQVQGGQSAYDRAMAQFNADQARQLQAGTFSAGAANQAAAANAAAQNQASQFGGQNAMLAQQLAEQSRQYGANLGLQGSDLAARTGLTAAQQYGILGGQQQQSDLERLNALAAAGGQQQAQAQQLANVGYENFVNARDFDRNNLTFLSGLLRGQPYATSSSTTGPAPTTASQIGGLGLGALGAYKLFAGG